MRKTIKSLHRYTNKHYHAKERRIDGRDIKNTKMQCLGKKACELLAVSRLLAWVYSCWDLSIACQTLEPQTLTQS
jgi:hypothetical protein